VVLRRHRKRLQQFDALVTTNKWFARRRRDGRPLQVLTGHGAGDRRHGFFADTVKFDLVLTPGEEKRRRIIEQGLAPPERVRVIGYPKFDLVRTGPLRPPPAFDAPRPVVVYNPHFDADESSWFAWGERILDQFRERREYNLIFAPHMNLFAKERDPIPRRFHEAGNIHVDLDSPALLDMSYTAMADIYLGDVSSQVYEFVAFQPRPCVFLDIHGVDWEGNRHFRMWQMGPVVTDPARLDDALRKARERAPHFQSIQRELVRESFSVTNEPAGVRGAREIVEFLRSQV
jgi:CDP-glycerol glycerophosphotransferase (TagB/SpsB family)